MRFKIVKTLAPYGFHVVDTADGRMVASFKRKLRRTNEMIMPLVWVTLVSIVFVILVELVVR